MEQRNSQGSSGNRGAKQFALRFISGKYQGGEFPLPSQRELVVGRSSELDIVLVEDMVSRRHAKITVSGDQIFIQDLGSTNGSFVNGEKVKRARLSEGDRILIGTSIIKLVAIEGAAGGDLAGGKQSLEEAAQGRRGGQRSMSGVIEEVPLPDLLQLFATSKKSGVLVVRSDDDTGRIYLDKGRIVYTVVNDNHDVPPMKAVVRVLRWMHGTFDMEPPEEREFPQTIDMSTEGVLMEAMRQMDEAKRLAPDMPPLESELLIPSPLIAVLRDLNHEELDVFQLAINNREVGTVLNKSTQTDLETSMVLIKLINDGYLRVK